MNRPHTEPREERITLKIYREVVLNEVRQCAYVEGDIMAADDEHRKHQIFDITEDGNIDRVSRVLSLAIADCRELLYPYSATSKNGSDSYDNGFDEAAVIEIALNIPPTVSYDTVRLLKELIHEYAVACIMTDWLSITKAESAENWERKAEALRQKIHNTIQLRTKRMKRRLSPFN